MLDDKAPRKKLQSVVEMQSQLHKEVLDKVNASCGMQRVAASRGNLPSFAVSEYVLAIRVRHSGSTAELLMTWNRPWHVVVAQRPHVYVVQNIVSGKVRDVHVARMVFT